MTPKERAWIVDWAVAAVAALICGSLVAAAGGPSWAIVGTMVIIYWTAPKSRQDALR